MAMTGLIASISLFGVIAILVGVVLLQIFLSKRDSRWPGLVLPIITLCYSFLAIFSLAVYEYEPISAIALKILMIFLISNIPTLILGAIYFAARADKRKNKEINKMNIKDL